jgi:protein-S-isoprenylcysteine O-methyltransferase Ste14
MIKQIFLTMFVIAYVFTLLLVMAGVKKGGADPRGVDDYYSTKARIGSLTIFLWLAIAIAYVVSPESLDHFVTIPVLRNFASELAGALLCIIGLIIGLLGMVTLGENFRISFPEEETQLITHGIYNKTRNPIVLSIFLIMIGTVLLIPNLLSVLNLIVNLIGYDAKASDEEQFMAERFGDEWEQYASKTGKYLPKINRN